MFKKLGQKIRQLSLSEQFFSIILIVFFAVAVATLILVNTQIDEFVNASAPLRTVERIEILDEDE